jgi:hypothetical protein
MRWSRSSGSAQGKLFTRLKGLDYECSATSVNSLNRSVILTAGHCVYQRGEGFARRLAFVPAYGNHLRPLGTWVYDRVFVAREWYQCSDAAYDLAAIVVEPERGRGVNDAAGALPIAANYAPDQQTYAAFGYPATFADAQQLWRCDSPYGGVDPNARPSAPQPIAIGCDMGDGSSGGGWILPGGAVGSLTAFSYDRHPDVLYGPYFGERAQALFSKAERADPNEPEFDRNRFAACVMESSGCSHRFVAGDLPTLRFEDRRESHTAYRACVEDPDGRSCGDGRTGRRGRSDYLIYQSATVGRHVASWCVDGLKVKHWAFRIVPENARPRFPSP